MSANASKRVDMNCRPDLDLKTLERIFSFFEPNYKVLSVKSLNKHFREWVAEQHGPRSKLLDPRQDGPRWATSYMDEYAGTEHLSDLDKARFMVTAASGGQLGLLIWGKARGCVWHYDVSEAAAANGHIHVLKYALQHGLPWLRQAEAYNPEVDIPVGCTVSVHAAGGGHLKILQLLQEQTNPEQPSPHIGDATWCAAADGRHVRVMEWLKSQKVRFISRIDCGAAMHGQLAALRWLKQSGYRAFYRNGRLCDAAALKGHLDVLIWARDIGCPWDETTTTTAAMSDHLLLLKWARERGCPWDLPKCTIAAIANESLDVLGWLLENGAELSTDLCFYAAGYGFLEGLKLLRQRGCPWATDTCKIAALKGKMQVLLWAREQGAPWDEKTCRAAAGGGHLEILKWARDNGCPWDEETCTSAAARGQLDVLVWLRARFCPWEGTECAAHALFHGHLKVLEWVLSNGVQWTIHLYYTAVKSGQLEAVKVLRRLGGPWDTVCDQTCYIAAEHGHVHVLEWARYQGVHWNNQTCAAAAGAGKLEVLLWLRQKGCAWDERTCEAAAWAGQIEVLKWQGKG